MRFNNNFTLVPVKILIVFIAIIERFLVKSTFDKFKYFFSTINPSIKSSIKSNFFSTFFSLLFKFIYNL